MKCPGCNSTAYISTDEEGRSRFVCYNCNSNITSAAFRSAQLSQLHEEEKRLQKRGCASDEARHNKEGDAKQSKKDDA